MQAQASIVRIARLGRHSLVPISSTIGYWLYAAARIPSSSLPFLKLRLFFFRSCRHSEACQDRREGTREKASVASYCTSSAMFSVFVRESIRLHGSCARSQAWILLHRKATPALPATSRQMRASKPYIRAPSEEYVNPVSVRRASFAASSRPSESVTAYDGDRLKQWSHRCTQDAEYVSRSFELP